MQAGLVVSDPTYKLLGPYRDENTTQPDIAQVTAIFDRITEATSAAVIYSQHYGKGNQAAKESINRGAGSGVWARDADVITTMTKHANGDDYLSVEHTLRSFPRIAPFVVQWNFPLFTRALGLDPTDLKQPSKAGREPIYCLDDLVDCLNGQCLTNAEFEAVFMKKTNASEATFKRLLSKAEKRNLIYKCVIDQKWERIAKVT